MNVYQRIKKHNISEILLGLILVTLPLGFAVNSVSLILFLFATIYSAIVKGFKIKLNTIDVLFVLFYILCLTSLFWTNNIDETKGGLVRFLSYLIIPLGFTFNYNTNIRKDFIFNAFSKSLVFYGAYALTLGIFKAFQNKDLSYLFYHKLSNNLSNMNAIYLSAFISFGIAFFLNKKRKSKFEVFCVIFLSLFLVLLSSKIIITITLLLSVILYFKKFKLNKISLQNKAIILAVLLLFSMASLNFVNRFKTEFDTTKITEVLQEKDFGHSYIWTGFGLRVFQIKAFTEVLIEQKKIILGEGLNNSQKSLITKYKKYNLYPGFYNFNYHNQYIQIFAELGIIGLGILLLILFLILKKAIKDKDYFLLSFIILILVVCITESFLWRQRGMVFFITITLLFSQRKKNLIETKKIHIN
jgi:O-antigen ligase